MLKFVYSFQNKSGDISVTAAFNKNFCLKKKCRLYLNFEGLFSKNKLRYDRGDKYIFLAI